MIAIIVIMTAVHYTVVGASICVFDDIDLVDVLY